ncbi:MAG: hypothetical protein RLY16_1041 [Bacteroidota bacterium]|jgi:LruC domain-containing protein
MLGLLTLSAQNNFLPSLTLESGSKSSYTSICWDFDNMSVYQQANLISGSYCLRTSNLGISDNNGNNQVGLKSPWIKPTTGNITFSTKLENTNGATVNIVLYYIPYNHNGANNVLEGTPIQFASYSFATPLTTTVQHLSFSLPNAITNATQPCKILLLFTGGANNNRAFMDNVNIPGTYFANPSNHCLPAFENDDSDDDEACDDEEDHNDDATIAYNNYYPSSAGYGRLMFEDLWPAAGDYDFNDLVLSYRSNIITNAQNRVIEIQLTYIIEAIGASQQNGFGVQLNGVGPSSILSVTGTRTSGATWLARAANGTESGQTYANIIVYDNVNRFMANPGSIGINTTVGSSYVTPDTARVIIRFNSNSTVSFTDIVFNPYLIVNQTRSKEIHLVGFVPTSKAATNLFGTSEDNSSVSQQRYYESKTVLPWALDIPEQIPYSREKFDFSQSYPNMPPWARSKGAQNKTWYKNQAGNRVSTKLYSH